MAAIAGAGANILGGIIDFGLGQAAAQLDFKRQKKLIKNQPKWQVQGLRRAGLNPILAAGGGFSGGASAGRSSAGSVGDLAGAERAAADKKTKDTLRDQELINAKKYAELLDAQWQNQIEQSGEHFARSEVLREERRRTSALADQALLQIPGLRNNARVEEFMGPEGVFLERVGSQLMHLDPRKLRRPPKPVPRNTSSSKTTTTRDRRGRVTGSSTTTTSQRSNR